MSKINRSKLKSALKTFFAKRQGMSLESQVAMLTLLVGAAWAEGAQAAEADALPTPRLSASEQKAIAEIKALLQDGLTSDEIAQIIEATQQLETSQVTEVLEALLSDETLASENLDEMIEQLRAQLEQSRGEAIVLSPSAGKTAVAEAHKALESEFGADAPAAASSKVTVETPKEEDDDDKGIILLNSGDPTQTLGLAPALFAAGPLGPVLGGVVAAAALAGGGGGGGGPVVITQNGEAIDGYVVGADVFVKAADGTLTKVGTTDANGQFLGLDGTLGLKLSTAQAALHLVVSGGMDASTGLPFQGEMEAPAGSLVVTPLTTIIAKMMDQDPTLTAEQANDALVAKLGLAPGTDLLTLDPIQVANDPNSTPEEAAAALEAYQRALSIISLAQNAAAVGSLSFADAFDSVVSSISTNVVTEIGVVGVDGVAAFTDDTAFVTVATGGLADLNADAFTGSNLTAFIDAGKDVVGQIDVTVSIDDADSDRNEAEAGTLGTAASEELTGTDINDLIVGFAGDDTLLGGDGDDTLLGGLGNDSLIGGAGVDTIFGSEGDDTVAINLFTDGNDSIELGSGLDVVEVEGGGLFTLAFNANEVGNDDVHNSETGDLAVTLGVFGDDALSTRLDDEGLRFVGVDGGTFTVNDGVITGTFNEVVLGSAGADTIDDSAVTGNVYMHGGAGNDLLTSGSGNDVLFGGSGDDDLVGGAGNDSLFGGSGNDNLLGDAGDDTLEGGEGNDTMSGGAGEDLVELDVSADGSDAIDLGADADTIAVSGASQVRVTLDLDGVGNGSATDTNSDLAVAIQGEDENGEVTGDQSRSDDELIRLVAEEGTKFDVRDAVTDESYGDNFDQVILGSDAGDGLLIAGDPSLTPVNYFVAGGAGNDSITSGSGNDYISGGTGDDLLVDYGGNNTLVGGDGRDFLGVVTFSESIGSSLLGGDGNDILAAFGGDNTLDGGVGDDVLLAGAFGNEGLGVSGDDVANIDLADEGEDLISLGGGYNTVNVKGEGQFRINLNPNLVGDAEYPGLAFGLSGSGELPLNVYLGLEDSNGDAPTFVTGPVNLSFSNITELPDVPIASTRAEDEGTRFVAVDGGTFDVRERSEDNPNEGTEIGDTFKVVSLGTIAGESLDESETVGDVYVNAGFGDDSVTGGAGNDYLEGAAGNDVVDGGAGDDNVLGGIGEDSLSGGEGNDSVFGGLGDDTVAGDAGDDSIEGGEGNDSLSGGEGNDSIFGGLGDDTVAGDAGDDSIAGGEGNDSLSGGEGNDTLSGGAGNDLLVGGEGDDSITGGEGNDSVEVDVTIAGSDSIDLGDGDDFISITGAEQVRITLDLAEVGNGSITNTNSELPVGIQAEDANGDLTGDQSVTVDETIRLVAEEGTKLDVRDSVTDESYGDNFDQVLLGAEGNDQIFDFFTPGLDSGNRFIATGSGDDLVYLITSGSDDFISGGAGNDTLIDLSGSNTLLGGDGDDSLQSLNYQNPPGTSTNSLLDGGDGNDFLQIQYGVGTLIGGNGSDAIYASILGTEDELAVGSSLDGGEGNDYLLAFGGDNTLDGGAGNDTMFAISTGNDVAMVNLADEGDDLISLGGGLNTVKVEGEGQFRINFNADLVGDDPTVASGSYLDASYNVYLGLEDGKDSLPPFTTNGFGNGNGTDSDITSTRTSDEGMRFVAVDGGTFDVRVRSDSNPNEGTELGDTFKVVSLGTTGDDILDESATVGDVYIHGGAGSDSLVGGDGNDILIGGRNSDYIIQLSETSFTTASDNDTFVGGKGDDLIFGNKGADLAIVDLMTDGNDSINLGIDDTISNFGFSGDGEDTVRISGGSNVTVTLNNAEVGNGSGYKSDNVLAVSLQADGSDFVVTTDDEAIRIESAGDETFTIKDDTVVLGSGFDAIVLGGAGNDFINEQDDFGGSTENTFINGGQGNDVIYSGSGSDLIFGGSSQDFISAGAGNDVIYGGDGSDNMIGGAGNDTIFGGADSDTLSVNLSTDGSDSVDLGSGFDFVRISGSADTRITLDLAGVGNDDIHSSGDTLAASLQSEDLQGALTGDILHLDDEGLRLVAQDQISSNGTVLEDAKFHVHDLNGAEIDPDHTFDEVVLGTSGDDYVSDFISESLNNFFGPLFNENFVPTPAPDVFVEGGMGNDILFLGSGDDYISGGAGNDVMFGSAGDDTFVGGAGDDRIGNGVFNGNSSNIFNADESGNDVFRINLETDGNDTVYLGSGLDTVELRSTASHVRLTLDEDLVGSGTNDNVFVRAEDENAALTGNILTTDNDGIRFVAEEGSVFELNAHSTALGDHFSVVSLGTFGNDTLDESGTLGNVYINGGAGSDSLVGGDGNDVLIGGRNSDYIIQLSENSFTIAPDDDTFVGGKGDDVIFGNKGVDLAIVNLMTDGNDAINLGTDDVIRNFGLFNAGVDTVSVSGGSNVTVTLNNAEVGNGDGYKSDNVLAVSLQADGSDFVVTTDDEAIRIESEGDETFTIKDDSVVLGSGYDAIVLGSSDDDFINESTGNLFINGGQGNDVIYSGEGSDLVFGGTGRDVIFAGAGHDVVYGGDGSDAIFGGAGNDTIYGGNDADTLSVNLSTDGSDSVDMGSGFDTVFISGSLDTRITLNVAAVGNDDIHSSGDTLAVSVQSEDEEGALQGDILHIDDEGLRFVAQDTLNVNGTIIEDAKFDVHDLNGLEVSPGDRFDEVVLGTSGADFVSDYISKTVNDYLSLDFNKDFVPSASPDVFVEGGMGDDILVMADGNDYISGGEGNDIMFGSAGDDTFIAGAGDDVIGSGSFSFDNYNPQFGFNSDESGNDVLIVNLEADGNDRANLGSGYDTVELSTTAETVRMTFNGDSVGTGGANDVLVQAEDSNGDPTGNTLTTDDEGIRFDAPDGTQFSLHVNGTSLGDHFGLVQLGTTDADVFDESGRTDGAYLNGGLGNDSITGGLDRDYLVGGADNDTIVGGAGNDSMFGGSGEDLIRVNLDTDDSDFADLGSGIDLVDVSSTEGQIRVSFDSAGVGQGDLDFVTAQVEDGMGNPTGSILTTDDEGIRFVAQEGQLFDLHVNGSVLGDFGIIDLGSSGDDTFNESLSTSRVYIQGGLGDDVITGGSADDILLGGEGNDVLMGGAGNDIIAGGEGNDDLARFDDTGRVLSADDVFSFDSETNTLTFSDSQSGGSVEVDTLTGIEFLDFGAFNGSNPVFVTEAQLAILDDANVAFAANNDVTLLVDGSTLSENHLTLNDLSRLGIDHVSVMGPALNITLGSDLAESRVELSHVTEAQLAYFDDAHVGFAGSLDVTLAAAGTTLSDNHLTLNDLRDLGIDHVQTDGPLVNIEAGAAGDFSPNSNFQAGIDFTHVNPDTQEIEASIVKLGLTEAQLSSLITADSVGGYLVDDLVTVAGKDQIALLEGGEVTLSEEQADHLFGLGGDPKLSFADSFSFAGPDNKGFDSLTDVTLTKVILNVAGDTTSDNNLSLFDLARLGVDEVHLPTGVNDEALNLNLGLGETFEHFASEYLTNHEGDFAGAFNSASVRTQEILYSGNNLMGWSVTGSDPADSVGFTGGDNISKVTLFDATSEDAAAVYKSLAQAGDTNYQDFGTFEGNLFNTLETNFADQLGATTDFVSVLVADAGTQGTVLADSELSAADLDNLGFDKLLLGQRDVDGNIEGVDDLASLLVQLNGFDLDSLTDDASNGSDVNQDSVALVNIDPSTLTSSTFAFDDLIALSELGLDKIAIGNSFDDFVVNGELDINDLINNHPDNLP